MDRRRFVALTLAAGFLPLAAQPVVGQSALRSVRAFQNRMTGDNRRHNHGTINDPTGSARTRRVERFELRGGDCSNQGDCTPRRLGDRMVARTRVERVLGYRLENGDEGALQYSIFLPEGEYGVADAVSSTFGQLLWAVGSGRSYDSFPIFSLDSVPGTGGRLEFAFAEPRMTEGERVRRRTDTVGSLSRDFLGRWHDIQLRFRLSTGSDGYLQASMNGRSVAQFAGRTALPSGFLEVRYGIYQTGTNLHSGGAGAMPTQVALFSNVGLFAAG